MKNEDEEDNIKIFDLIEDGSNEEHKDEKSSNNDVILNEDYKNRIYIADKDKENQNLYIKKAFTSFRVWKLFILYFLCSFVYNAVNTVYRNIAIRKNISTTIAQILSIIGFIIGCFCCFLWGYLIQKFSFKLLISIINIAGVIIGFCFYFSLESSFLFALFVILQQIFSCGILIFLNIHIMNIYKMEYYVHIFGVVSFAYGISLICSSAFSYIIENNSNDIDLNYAIIFCVGGFMSLISTIFGFYEGENKFEVEQEK
jgi:MFS family permease